MSLNDFVICKRIMFIGPDTTTDPDMARDGTVLNVLGHKLLLNERHLFLGVSPLLMEVCIC